MNLFFSRVEGYTPHLEVSELTFEEAEKSLADWIL